MSCRNPETSAEENTPSIADVGNPIMPMTSPVSISLMNRSRGEFSIAFGCHPRTDEDGHGEGNIGDDVRLGNRRGTRRVVVPRHECAVRHGILAGRDVGCDTRLDACGRVGRRSRAFALTRKARPRVNQRKANWHGRQSPAIMRLPPERWMSGLSRTPGKRV